MGQRLRLKASFVIPENWTKAEKAVLRALKKYGAIVADNGGFFSISVAPDDRFAANAFSNLATIDINNFEVVANDRSARKDRVHPARSALTRARIARRCSARSVALDGTSTGFTGSGDDPVGARYAGPGDVTFGDATQAANDRRASARRAFTRLMLSAADGAPRRRV